MSNIFIPRLAGKGVSKKDILKYKTSSKKAHSDPIKIFRVKKSKKGPTVFHIVVDHTNMTTYTESMLRLIITRLLTDIQISRLNYQANLYDNSNVMDRQSQIYKNMEGANLLHGMKIDNYLKKHRLEEFKKHSSFKTIKIDGYIRRFLIREYDEPSNEDKDSLTVYGSAAFNKNEISREMFKEAGRICSEYFQHMVNGMCFDGAIRNFNDGYLEKGLSKYIGYTAKQFTKAAERQPYYARIEIEKVIYDEFGPRQEKLVQLALKYNTLLNLTGGIGTLYELEQVIFNILFRIKNGRSFAKKDIIIFDPDNVFIEELRDIFKKPELNAIINFHFMKTAEELKSYLARSTSRN